MHGDYSHSMEYGKCDQGPRSWQRIWVKIYVFKILVTNVSLKYISITLWQILVNFAKHGDGDSKFSNNSALIGENFNFYFKSLQQFMHAARLHPGIQDLILGSE